MSTEGPALTVLTQRLAQTPPDCFDPGVTAAAVVADTMTSLDGTVLARDVREVLRADVDVDARARAAAAVTCWLLLEPDVGSALGAERAARALRAVQVAVQELAPVLDPGRWTTTPAGREETARSLLRSLSLHPAGENEAQAEDRWSAVSTAVRRASLQELEIVQRRARELAAALAAKKAKEAVAQYTYS